MTPVSDPAALLRLVPEISRARGWRLYSRGRTPIGGPGGGSRSGGRIVDLWQDGGRAILGHTPPGLLRSMKNSAERGLFAPLPHSAEGRFLKALDALFGGSRRFRFYSDEYALQNALAASGIPKGQCAPWRPFLENPVLPVWKPILPFHFPGAPQVLALDLSIDSSIDPSTEGNFPPSQVLSPLILSIAARGIYDLIAAGNAGRGKQSFPKTDRALKNNPQGSFGSRWKRQGIYLFFVPGPSTETDPLGPSVEPDEYPSLFRTFLKEGFLLPPSPSDPAILPGELSPGEDAKLAKLLSSPLKIDP